MEKKIEGIRPETLELEWLAIYTDGTSLAQNYGVGRENGERHFGDIDLEKLALFCLVENEVRHFSLDVKNQAILIGEVPFFVEFPRNVDNTKADSKIVYFRRVRNDFHPEGTVTTVRYAIGFQAVVQLERYKKNFQQYLFINGDGSFSLSQEK